MDPIIKYYTVADLKQWLIHNKPTEGLSERIIAPQRAYAIMNNPFVIDDDAVLCAIFENGEPAAYTAAFPEVLERPKRERIWWFSTLYCRPESTGKGYGLIVVGTLAEIYGVENCFDMDGAKETIEIFNYLGLITAYSKQFVFSPKHISINTLRGKCATLYNFFRNISKKRLLYAVEFDIDNELYSIKYCNYIDDLTYDFMRNHSSSDMMFRSKDMYDWILHYSFLINSTLILNTRKDTYFTSNVRTYYMQLVRVYRNDLLIGVYIYRVLDEELSISYLYYDDKYANVVFSSIAKHFALLKMKRLKTTSEDFATWFLKYDFTEKFENLNISFSYPRAFKCPNDLMIQQGDGDMFV